MGMEASREEELTEQIGRLRAQVAEQGQLLATSGLQPMVAVALVEVGVGLRGVITALNLEKGIEILSRMVKEERFHA
jgi:rsbT antagonist protein RsbS